MHRVRALMALWQDASQRNLPREHVCHGVEGKGLSSVIGTGYCAIK